MDMMRILKQNIKKKWPNDWRVNPTRKIKECPETWESSFQENRLYETVLARLRVNCTKNIHLVPRIENNYPLYCDCNNQRYRFSIRAGLNFS